MATLECELVHRWEVGMNQGARGAVTGYANGGAVRAIMPESMDTFQRYLPKARSEASAALKVLVIQEPTELWFLAEATRSTAQEPLNVQIKASIAAASSSKPVVCTKCIGKPVRPCQVPVRY